MKKYLNGLVLLGAVLLAVPVHSGAPAFTPVTMQDVRIGGFWHDQFRGMAERWLPHCFRQMEKGGAGEELLNLIATAEVLQGKAPSVKFKGCPWSDAYVYNTMEAACLVLEVDPGDDVAFAYAQQALRDKIEEWIPIILAAQEKSGYIHSFHDLRHAPHFKNSGDHEFYVMGYFIEMGIAHFHVTHGKDRRLYDAAIRCADHLDATFGPAPKITWMNGHPGMEYALCRLADSVNASEGAGKGDKYAALARFFLRNQSSTAEHNPYNQTDKPAVEMTEAAGHAVRAVYFYAGMTGAGSRTGDDALVAAGDRLFDSVVNRKYYVTGGVGSTGEGEAFSGDYDLPDNGYCEACAACGMSFWTTEFHRIHGGAKAEAVRERVAYNAILGALGRNFTTFYYQNPLIGDVARYPWHGCPCCVGNIPRALFALKDLAYWQDASKETLYVDQFLTMSGTIADVGGRPLKISQRTSYPWDGRVEISLDPVQKTSFTLAFRIPDRAESKLYAATPSVAGQFKLVLNGAPAENVEVKDGYARIFRKWREGDVVTFSFPMPVQRLAADERVQNERGKVALQRGPLVYDFEQADNGQPIATLAVTPDIAFKPVWKPDLLDGGMALLGGGFTAIPNYLRLNRGGATRVWMRTTPSADKLAGAVPTASFSREGMDPRRAIDGEPSTDFDFWPHGGTKEWLELALPKAVEIRALDVTWYEDASRGAGCKFAQSCKVSVKAADGSWKQVAEANDIKSHEGAFSFAPVMTTAVRFDLQLREGGSAGIAEISAE